MKFGLAIPESPSSAPHLGAASLPKRESKIHHHVFLIFHELSHHKKNVSKFADLESRRLKGSEEPFDIRKCIEINRASL